MYAHAQAPVRIGIAGGGTDLPVWTKERVGHCLSLAIGNYAHAVAITRPDRQVVASYRSRDEASAATEIANGLIRESALMHGFLDGIEVHTLSEVTSHGSGLGVSSSIAVCLAALFRRMRVLAEGMTSDPQWMDGGWEAFRAAVAKDAWTVEIDKLRRPIGRQDHMAAAYGGLHLYRFEGDTATVERTFSHDDARWVASHLYLLPLPQGHDSRAILSGAKHAETFEEASLVVPDAIQAIERRNLSTLGAVLYCGMKSKRQIPGAVPEWLDHLVDKIEAVSFGCKVAGAGGGGHIVVACEPDQVSDVEAATGITPRPVTADLHGVRCEGWL